MHLRGVQGGKRASMLAAMAAASRAALLVSFPTMFARVPAKELTS
jgi:hypothetical protein